jgi:hypothetical protein
VLTDRQFGDGFELSTNLIEEILGGVGHRDFRGTGAQTLAERSVVAARPHKAEGTPVSVREVSDAQAEIAVAEGSIEDDSPARA